MAIGNSQQLLISTLELILANEKCDLSKPLWRKLSLGLIKSRRNCYFQVHMKKRRCRSVVMKRRPRLDRRVRPRNCLERKVRILKKLVPNCEPSIGVEGLFRETADYILDLQMRVNVMKIMVNVMSGSNDE